jgi:hypothetical protein
MLLHDFPDLAHITRISLESSMLINVEGTQVRGSFVHSPLFFIFIQSAEPADSTLSFSKSHPPQGINLTARYYSAFISIIGYGYPFPPLIPKAAIKSINIVIGDTQDTPSITVARRE